MRIAFNVAGVCFLFLGGVWVLQGLNVLPGSYMSGQKIWCIIGGVLILVGAGMIVTANRRRI